MFIAWESILIAWHRIRRKDAEDPEQTLKVSSKYRKPFRKAQLLKFRLGSLEGPAVRRRLHPEKRFSFLRVEGHGWVFMPQQAVVFGAEFLASQTSDNALRGRWLEILGDRARRFGKKGVAFFGMEEDPFLVDSARRAGRRAEPALPASGEERLCRSGRQAFFIERHGGDKAAQLERTSRAP